MAVITEDSTNKREFQSLGWENKDGSLQCDGMLLEDLKRRLRREFDHQASPAYVYSSTILQENVAKYKEALTLLGDHGILSYSLKANSNPHIIKELRDAGVTMATTVSGNEILMAINCGFPPGKIIFNGNGKQRWEVELAVNRSVLLNIDSAFDAIQLIDISKKLGKKAQALLRLNPALDAETHPYLATALADSKFGVEMGQIEEVLRIIDASEGEGKECNKQKTFIELKGVHIHIGSAITKIQIYAEMMKIAAQCLDHIQKSGWPEASVINLGGGLGIIQENPVCTLQNSSCKQPGLITATNGTKELRKTRNSDPAEVESLSHSSISVQEGHTLDLNDNSFGTSADGKHVTGTTYSDFPTPKQLVEAVFPHMPQNAIIILEPGRSLVATAGIVLTDILGIKTNAGKEYIVVDAAMTEVIRPALYGAIHPVSYITPPETQDVTEFDVVGPVCESGDFIIRRCLLKRPPFSSISTSDAANVDNMSLCTLDSHINKSILCSRPGSTLAIWNTGAYCSSMSSNYNLRPHVVEVLIKSPTEYKVIRKPQTFKDLVQNF